MDKADNIFLACQCCHYDTRNGDKEKELTVNMTTSLSGELLVLAPMAKNVNKLLAVLIFLLSAVSKLFLKLDRQIASA